MAARPLSTRIAPSITSRINLTQLRAASVTASQAPSAELAPAQSGPIDLNDPEMDLNMNGGYPSPPPVKRSLRDPYDNWWDPQERRNYGEALHEDNDILGVFSTEPYSHYKPGFGAVLFGTFIVSVLGLCGVVSMYYPDKASAPRTFPDGLEKALGGSGALRARVPSEDKWE